MPRVRLLATGGTIASTRDDATGAMRAAISGAELVAAVPGLGDLAIVEVEDVALVNGWDMTLPLMADLARRVDVAAADGVDGVVVTHGTDTIEETAFALDLLGAADIPVVVTGAMRGGGGPDSDGARNLLAAVGVAGSARARGIGAVVVMNDEVHAARWAHKSHTTALSTFVSPGVGPLGAMDDTGLVLHWRPPSAAALRDPDGRVPEPPEDIALVWAATGVPVSALTRSADGARGVVIAGTGTGNVPGSWLPAVRDLVAGGIAVVLASRCEGGRVAPTYGGDGGAWTLLEAGVVPAGHLLAVKARVALAFAVGSGLDGPGIRGLFGRF